MTCALWMWASASFGACLGFMLAGMLHAAHDADDRDEHLNGNENIH